MSERVRRAALAVCQDAHESVHAVAWVVTRAGDGEVVVAAAGDGSRRAPAVGERLRPDPEADLVVPLGPAGGSRFGSLCGLGAGHLRAEAGALARLERLAGLLGAVVAADREADGHATRAEAEARRARQVEQEALSDSLTGVANRRAWDQAVEAEERRSRRYGGTAAVVVLDLDDLKEVNDTQGHLHGDLLLRLVARVITEASRESDLVARTGGDEFAVLALNCEEPQLQVLVGRLRTALEAEGVSASVGGACRREGTSMMDAWAAADQIMFAEKDRRKR